MKHDYNLFKNYLIFGLFISTLSFLKLSKPINTNEVDITKLGLLMGGKNE